MLRAIGAALLLLLAPPASAEAGRASETAAAQAEPRRGPVTNLPLPRFVSLKAAQGNARRGPSLSHRIDWVFVRRDMPLEVTGEYGHWRRVRDRDGAGGWVHYALLSGVRTAILQPERTTLLLRPGVSAAPVAEAERGVVVRVAACEAEWCKVAAGGQRGWVRRSALWGVYPGEHID